MLMRLIPVLAAAVLFASCETENPPPDPRLDALERQQQMDRLQRLDEEAEAGPGSPRGVGRQ